MAVTLNRKTDTDDDGSGTIGTVRNNAWLQDLQGRVDDALAAIAEESTFTPALKFGGASVGMTGTFTGVRRRVGKLTFITIRITLTAKGSSTGAATITGLPEAAAAACYAGLAVNYAANLGVSVASLVPYIGSSTSVISLTYFPAAGATGVTNMIESSFTNTTDIILSGCYPTDA